MIREYTFLSSTHKTLRKSDHILAIKELSIIPKKCFKKEHKLCPKSQDPVTSGNKGEGWERGKERKTYWSVCMETEIAI